MPVKAAVDNGWSQFHSGNSFAGAATKGPDLRIYNTPRFQVGADLGAGWGTNSSSPIVMNNKVFAYSQSGAVTAFSEFNGAELWSTAIAPATFGSWSSPSADVASNSVYMGSDANVYRIDAESGQILWTSQLTEYGGTGETYGVVVNAAPTIVPNIGLNGEGLVYQQTYGSFGGGARVHAFNVADGSIAWTYDTPGQGQGEVAYNPSNGLIYAASNGTGSWADGRGGIVALDAATGNVAWASTDSHFAFNFGSIAYDNANNRVAAGGYSFYSYAGLLVVDGDTGATISYTGDDVAPSGDYRPTIGDDNLIYVAGAEFQDGPFVFAFDALTGDKVWQSDIGWGNWTHSATYAQDIGAATDVVYAGDQYGSAYGMFDADTGELLTTLGIGGGPAAIANRNIYFLTGTGQLVAFGPAVPEPTSLMLTGSIAMLFVITRRRQVQPV
jgi:outer membrane protein assembly factor BamB